MKHALGIALKSALLLLVFVFLSGCPADNKHTFTSANPEGGRFNFGPEGGMVGDTDGTPDAEGDVPQREVVEPDVIRQVGDMLYVLNQYRGLSIVDLDQQTLLAQVPTYGYPRDLYVVEDRAYVLVGHVASVAVHDDLIAVDIASRLYVLDISDPESASIIGDFSLEGDFSDSRLVGDVLYAISTEFTWSWEDGAVSDVRKQAQSASWVSSIYIGDPENIQIIDSLSFEGLGNVVQATNFALFVAASYWQRNETRITYVDIADPGGAIQVRGNAVVPGQVADRFKMDAWNGVLRVASNTWWPERDVYVTTIDLSNPDMLEILGSLWLENAAGETLFATRFDGPRAYLVTYLMVDPLFVLDLADPTAPQVLGELKVPGWSTHIEPRGDTLIALGVDDSDWSWRASVSLFDVDEPATPTLLGRESFGEGWSWSTAQQDVKAFTVLADTIIIPFAGWWEGNQGGFQRLQFLNYDATGLSLRGYVDLQGQILRSFAYQGRFYAVTTEQVAIIDAADMDAPTVVDSIGLAAYVRDYIPIASGGGVEIVSEREQGAVRVRRVDVQGALLGELRLDFPEADVVFLKGDTLLLVGTDWYPVYGYRVAKIRLAETATPQLVETMDVAVQPWWGGWWDIYPMEWEMAPAMGDGWGMGWRRSADSAYMVGDTLVLRCVADTYDTVLGDARPTQGLALLPLASLSAYETVGLGFAGQVEQLHLNGEELLLGIREDAGYDLRGRALSAYYVRTLQVAPLAAGPAANVPGRIVAYDPASAVLVLQDMQYTNLQDFQQVLRSVRWDGAAQVTPLDRKELPPSTGTVVQDQNRLFFD